MIPDGSIKYLQVVGRPSTDEGRRSEFVGAVTDITNHRRAEEKIREQEMELRQILDLTPHHLYVLGLTEAYCMSISLHSLISVPISLKW